MQQIKNIIFDFGGVIYDIDHLKVIEEFKKLGIENFDEMYSHAIQNKLFERLETGELSETNFISEVKKYISSSVTDLGIIAAWNSILVGFRKERLDLLFKLKKHYKLFLLSNSNSIHHTLFLKQFCDQTSLSAFADLFEKDYFSFEMGMRKPDVEAYEYVLKNSNLKGEECLFIDDSEQNIEPARKAGMKAYHLKEGEEIMDLFENDLLIDFS